LEQPGKLVENVRDNLNGAHRFAQLVRGPRHPLHVSWNGCILQRHRRVQRP
jgi:hypothetical protein